MGGWWPLSWDCSCWYREPSWRKDFQADDDLVGDGGRLAGKATAIKGFCGVDRVDDIAFPDNQDNLK